MKKRYKGLVYLAIFLFFVVGAFLQCSKLRTFSKAQEKGREYKLNEGYSY